MQGVAGPWHVLCGNGMLHPPDNAPQRLSAQWNMKQACGAAQLTALRLRTQLRSELIHPRHKPPHILNLPACTTRHMAPVMQVAGAALGAAASATAGRSFGLDKLGDLVDEQLLANPMQGFTLMTQLMEGLEQEGKEGKGGGGGKEGSSQKPVVLDDHANCSAAYG